MNRTSARHGRFGCTSFASSGVVLKPSSKMRGTLAVFHLFCLCNCHPVLGGCRHQLTGERGQIRIRPDVTSDHCEWDITTDPDRIILINFEKRDFQRGTENCTGDVLTFHDGGSRDSRIVDTFCDVRDGTVAPFHLSSASTGHQLHVVFERGHAVYGSKESNLTFTTREIYDDPFFDDNTFVPQTVEGYDVHTAANFVRMRLFDWWIYDENYFAPFAYRTDRKTATGGDILEFYIGFDENDLEFDLTPDIVFTCNPTHPETVAFCQLFLQHDRAFPDDDWPFIPFYTFWPRKEDVAVIKFTFWNVKVGVENAALNEMEIVTNGQVFRTKLIVKACPIGRFGRFCAERCQCFNGASCHSFNGACRCAPGWRGRSCSTGTY
ncbi:uncharacterized protein [Branchiostoma lanceolatum]|uniref:uncharacterized protein n=1 Tax=Branchiostoma lanceolatum TaxID=7740 RepID=UPI003454C278